MKVNKIQIKGFKGIKEFHHDFQDTVTVIHGPIGSGKSSVIQAITHGITGVLPTMPVHKGFKKAEICLDIGDLEIAREVLLPAKKAVKIVGRKVGIGASEEYISEQLKVGNEIMKIVTSSDVIRNLKPADFASIFLSESEEKMKMEELLDIFKGIQSKEKLALMEDEEEDELTADVISAIKGLFFKKVISLEDINKAYEEGRKLKNEKDALYKNKAIKAKDFLEAIAPEYSEREIREKLEEVIGIERNIMAYNTTVQAYNNAVENKQKQNKKIARLRLDIGKLLAEKPDETAYEKSQDKIKTLESKIQEQKYVVRTLGENVKQFESTILELEKPICPISGKLICKTDKSICKSELEESILKNNDSIKKINGMLVDLEKDVYTEKQFLVSYLRDKERYDKCAIYKKQLTEELANEVILPEKPEPFSGKKEYAKQKSELQERLNYLRRYQDAEKEYNESLKLKRELQIYKFLAKALEPKGPIIKEFLETFATALEEACNERAQLLRTGFSTRFVVEDGLRVLFKPKDGSYYLPFSNLSNGEKMFAELILTDLINSFCNSRILILDNTDGLDKESFKQMMEFLTREDMKELYDNIIISCVNHSELVEEIGKHKVDIIDIAKKRAV